VYWLPLAGICWMNFHGIEYPVLILIVLAYLLDYFYQRVRGGDLPAAPGNRYPVFLALTLFTIFATPFGAKLLPVPFISIEWATQYIAEFRNLSWRELFSLQYDWKIFPFQSLVNLLLLASLLSFILRIVDRTLKLKYVLLMTGGLFLLAKGVRFAYEFALLALPVWHPPQLEREHSSRTAGNIIRPILYAAPLILPLILLGTYFHHAPRYPFSTQNLPEGISVYLNRHGAGGNLLALPDNGGYLQWKLYPRYKIFMDMEVPFLFRDEDLFVANNMFTSAAVFEKVEARYKPAYIAVPVQFKKFKQIINKYPEYVPVFFDAGEILYAHRTRGGAEVKQFQFRTLEPFSVVQSIDEMVPLEKEGFIQSELQRMYAIFPEGHFINQVLAMIAIRHNQWERAAKHANRLLKNFPEDPNGYRLMGDALSGKKELAAARGYYEQALSRAGEKEKKQIRKQLASLLNQEKKYRAAYRLLTQQTNIFDPDTSPRDLFELGALALSVGENYEALLLLNFAKIKTPPEDTPLLDKIQEKLKLFREDYPLL
jgi:tetratricopeptide (TPR) repeat protein